MSDDPAGRARHALVVSFGYEPLAHVSATRATYMGRELSALGWEVSVLTVDWSHPLPARVPSAAQSVERALPEPAPRRVAIDGRLVNPAFDPRAIDPNTEPPRRAPLRKLGTLRRTLGAGPFAGWAREAAAAAAQLHRARPVDVVWAIHGDDSCHAVAHGLAKRFGIPWVADFKDPWDRYHSPLARPVQRLATARRLRTAAALTETCAAQAESDRRRFQRPTHVVYSGYDAALMESAQPVKPGEGFCLAYLGRIGNAHDVSLVPALFEELRRRGGPERLELELHQYALVPGQFQALLAAAQCAHLVRDHALLPRAEVFGVMRGSDVLLLLPLTARAGKQVGLKEIECLASGTPVLVLGEPLEELAPVMRASPRVCIARTADDAAGFLESEARARGQAGPSPRRAAVNDPALLDFTWAAQARRLSEILASCCERAASGPPGHARRDRAGPTRREPRTPPR